MATVDGPVPLSDSGHAPMPEVDAATLQKVTIGAVAGTVIEWFDFAIYGFLAPYLATAFFPGGAPLVGVLQTFAVFAIAFALALICRPQSISW